MKRSRSIEIYLKEGIEEDDHIYDIWKILQKSGRPQDSFRRALKIGLSIMADKAELPRAARNAFDHDVIPGVDLSSYQKEQNIVRRKGQSETEYKLEKKLNDEPYYRYSGKKEEITSTNIKSDQQNTKENERFKEFLHNKTPVVTENLSEDIESSISQLNNHTDEEDFVFGHNEDVIEKKKSPVKKMGKLMG